MSTCDLDVDDIVHGEDNLEEKTREDADIRMYFLGLNLFNKDVICSGDGVWDDVLNIIIKYLRVGAQWHHARRGQLGGEDQGGCWQ